MTSRLPGSELPTPPPPDLADPPDELDPALAALPDRQRRFVLTYLRNPNGTAAAKAAGYAGDDPTLAVAASRLLKNDKVLKALQGARAAEARAAILGRDERLALLCRVVSGDVGGEYPPSWSERIQAAKLVSLVLGETGPRVAVQVDVPSYVVPLPPRFESAEAWSVWARREMAAHDAATTPSNPTAATSGRSTP